MRIRPLVEALSARSPVPDSFDDVESNQNQNYSKKKWPDERPDRRNESPSRKRGEAADEGDSKCSKGVAPTLHSVCRPPNVLPLTCAAFTRQNTKA